MPKTYWEIEGDGGSDIAGQMEAMVRRIKERTQGIKHTIAIGSGKGGVGKSLITGCLALALSDRGLKVGCLDGDMNGPSMARLLGVKDTSPILGDRAIAPPQSPSGIKVISTALLLKEGMPLSYDAPEFGSFIWRGSQEYWGILREFLSDVDWGELDILLIDTPPGTEKLSYFKEMIPALDGFIIVTIPSALSLTVVERQITLAKESGINTIGIIQNMQGYICPHCGEEGELFASLEKESLIKNSPIPYLGGIPFTPQLSKAMDAGIPYILDKKEEKASKAFFSISERFLDRIKAEEKGDSP